MSDKDSDQNKSPFPSGPSAPKPDWLKEVEDDESSSEANDDSNSSKSRPEPPQGLRETQPISTPADEASEDEPKKPHSSKADEQTAQREAQSAADDSTEKADEDKEKNDQTAEPATQKRQAADPDQSSSSLESQTLSKESGRPLGGDTSGNQPIQMQASSKPTPRPPLSRQLLCWGATFIGGSSLLAELGATLNFSFLAITDPSTGIFGIIYTLLVFALEGIESTRWLTNGLLSVGLIALIGIVSLGLNLTSIGIGLSILGLLLGELDRL